MSPLGPSKLTWCLSSNECGSCCFPSKYEPHRVVSKLNCRPGVPNSGLQNVEEVLTMLCWLFHLKCVKLPDPALPSRFGDRRNRFLPVRGSVTAESCQTQATLANFQPRQSHVKDQTRAHLELQSPANVQLTHCRTHDNLKMKVGQNPQNPW